jgi:hypothetical protein
MTTYNHERFVAQALQSVLDQVTTFPFELLVIEDCSTDSTRAIVQAFASRYPQRLRVVLAPTNENSNRLFAREWERCGSDYVAILDGDDYWTTQHKLQRQVELMVSHPEYVMSFHDVLVRTEDDVPNRFAETHRFWGPETTVTIEPSKLWDRCIPGCAPLIARRRLPALPEWYGAGKDGNWAHGDWPLFLFLSQFGEIGYIDELMGVYRVHSGGMWSGLDRLRQNESAIEVLEGLLEVMPAAEDTIRVKLAAARELASIESRISMRYRTIATALIDPDAVAELIHAHVPLENSVVCLEPVLRPVVLPHCVLTIPSLSGVVTQIFAVEPSGTREVSWIAPGYVYEFQLRDDSSGKALGIAAVVADQLFPRQPLAPSRATVSTGDSPAYIVAAPNPAETVGTHARTEIRWSAGCRSSKAHVEVATYALDHGMPRDDAAAIAALEEIRASGESFLFVPSPCQQWLAFYEGLGRHLDVNYRLVGSDEVGDLYDLRRTVRSLSCAWRKASL